ncbi:DUF3014 domain-containing protein [Variovorax ginsengisoli]|uniref:DUF3014 domain-containing protein n=1 Tax=Variovorax ginsengisoli TaxID=363844 RepID=A0ABT8SD43_9BURK|nr:DUF3014 domain-containing protein [Variovorax ginsengisoli]MDN8617661.1 DUF3014 domain-containing protein [Variovorax ginsengisoli]MDO1536831.1 DUF3014 domain-containing protein [Variovorax ginsengisoli]
MPERDPADFRPARESSVWTLVVVVVVILAAAFGWWRWSLQKEPPPAPSAASAPPPPDRPADAPAPAPVATGPQNLVDALAQPDAALPALNDADGRVAAALNELLGKKAVASFLDTSGFVRHFVATVDNLPRAQASSRMWPTQRAPKAFEVQGNGEVKTIGIDNASRYTPFVLFAESVDSARAAALYARLYPLFQQAYEELGYPNRYFNDRLVAVIDHLLQAPEPQGPVQVKLTAVKGEMAGGQPWVSYEFVDPKLESLSAGQKMLVRMGPVNERRMKAKLKELRAQVATGAVAKK